MQALTESKLAKRTIIAKGLNLRGPKSQLFETEGGKGAL